MTVIGKSSFPHDVTGSGIGNLGLALAQDATHARPIAVRFWSPAGRKTDMSGRPCLTCEPYEPPDPNPCNRPDPPPGCNPDPCGANPPPPWCNPDPCTLPNPPSSCFPVDPCTLPNPPSSCNPCNGPNPPSTCNPTGGTPHCWPWPRCAAPGYVPPGSTGVSTCPAGQVLINGDCVPGHGGGGTGGGTGGGGETPTGCNPFVQECAPGEGTLQEQFTDLYDSIFGGTLENETPLGRVIVAPTQGASGPGINPAVIIVVLIVLAAGGAYWYYKKRKGGGD